MGKVHITTFGCQMNEYDSARILDILTGLGYRAAAGREEADLLIFNTCSVRAKAQNKLYSFLGQLRDYKKTHPQVRIAVTGCLAQQEGRRMLKALPQVDLVLGPDALPDLPRLLPLVLEGRRMAEVKLEGQADLPLSGRRASLVSQVTVMRGCDNFCSYCVVPYVRGREKSRPAGAIADEVEALTAGGAREVHLLGQNVNSYRDEEGVDFPRLLTLLARIPDLLRIRFTTSHPKDLSPALMETLASEPKVMKGLHLPVQAGSDRILAAMKRGYTRTRYLDLVRRLRETVPEISLSGDIIVGFPGEKEEDFRQTMSLLDEVGYDFLFSFQYSDRPLTPAGVLPGKVSEEEKRRRLLVLQARQREISLTRHQALLGRVAEVLVEGPAKKGHGWLRGREAGGRTVNFAGPPGLRGRLIKVKLESATVNSLRAVRLTPLETIAAKDLG
ncbi:MAG: tRNA (N6-isopentenyl adenosine(37)-C2)-methylthiotransferase MiaB [Desulfarculales bacterium]|jgi:tRNA-2-methylthio-N6-dimethylallyladenosine synthase|nr:tRNA (N6-isopentenyl adenosine(37)-C2)-methylthiotransferase MiaB [Desulfarculales bacterium]